jgi:5-methylthioadenosine/S-adenosylhomocysteine deaminase
MTKIIKARWILPDARADIISDGATAVDDSYIVGVGTASEIISQYPDAAITDLKNSVIMPGMINAHQHGRGLSQLLLGYPDDSLESWIAARQRHGPPNIYNLTRLAAESMLSNGVTATLHANYSYGSGNFQQELQETIRAYIDAGLRATICIGFQDQGDIVYPGWNEDQFVKMLPQKLQPKKDAAAALKYMPDVDKTIDLLHNMISEYGGQGTIDFAYGPAGPQWVSDSSWKKLAKNASEKDIGIHFHLLESPTQARTCKKLFPDGTLQHLQKLGVFKTRTSCAHAVYISEKELELASEVELTLVTNPGSNMRLFNGRPPIDRFLAHGVNIALGTDNCALSDDEDFLRELRLAQLLSREPGIKAVGASARKMLEIATIGGANAAFMDNALGTLQTGAPADLVAIDMSRNLDSTREPKVDITDLIVSRLNGRDVVCTMVAGKILYTAQTFDEERIENLRNNAVELLDARVNLTEDDNVSTWQENLKTFYSSD